MSLLAYEHIVDKWEGPPPCKDFVVVQGELETDVGAEDYKRQAEQT